MEQITLNMIPKGITPICHASQYDNGRVIRLNIMDGLQGYVLSNESVQLNVRKPDMNIVTTDVDTTSGNTFVDIVTTEQMTACEGDNLCEIVLSTGDVVIASLNFIMRVEVDVLKDGIESETEIHNLATQVAGLVASEVEDQYDSGNVIFDNEPTEGHGNGYTVTSEGIRNAIDNALDMTDTASGAIATFESEYALPLRNFEIEINAVQEGSGTPSPSNPRAISGFDSGVITRCGVNLWDEEWENGIWNSNGTKETSNDAIRSKNYIAVAPNSRIYLVSPYKTIIRELDINKNVIGTLTPLPNQVITTSPTTKYIVFCTYVSDHVTTYSDNISFNYPSTDTDYHAYNGTTVTISLGQTVYGGLLDVTTGLLTVDRASVTLNGSEEWNNKTGLANIFSYSNPSIKDWGGNLTAVSKIMADTLPTISQTAMVNGRYGICSFSWGHQICVRVENISSAVDLKTYLASNPLQVVYELATPQTIQLTPTQINAIVGTNNVFTDTNGDTSLEYYTNRGEQTVRIAEGVAVDVINNKNIDNLTTTNKTLVGAVNEVNKGLVKSVFLTTTYNCSYSDANTIGYRGTGPDITTLTGYPTGKNILAVVIERSYVDNIIYPAITSLDTNTLYTESKNSGTAYIGMRVLYTD